MDIYNQNKIPFTIISKNVGAFRACGRGTLLK